MLQPDTYLYSEIKPSMYLVDEFIATSFKDANLSLWELGLLREVHHHLSNNTNFIEDVKELLAYLDKLQVNRFFSWLDFLLNLTRDLYFERLVFDVIFCFETQKLINTQTEHQFELSKRFLLELRLLDKRVRRISKLDCFLICILIASSRPDLMQCTLRQAVIIMDTQEPYELDTWFSLFFIKEGEHNFLSNHLVFLTAYETEVLIAMLQGESFRRFVEDRHPVSKKEQALLLTGKITQTSNLHILERYITYAKILKMAPHSSFVFQQYFGGSLLFQNQFKLVFDDVKFWQEVFQLVSKAQESEGDNLLVSMRDILDYLVFKRYNDLRPRLYSVRGRTLKSLERDMEEWHELQEYEVNREDILKQWDPLKIEPFVKIIDTNKYRIVELTSGIALLKEGRRMSHCVYSYLNNCYSHGTHIFSAQMRKRHGFKHVATIEVESMTLNQAQGPKNSVLKKTIALMIKEWATENELSLHNPKILKV